ncbi:MAG TPA: hypothetical protein VGC21_10225 [Telluria sp.]|jgi:hypothetical protein
MANGIDWFRWHHGTAADPKFGLVAKKAGARFGDVVTVWALILEQASANTERGTYDPIDPETTDFLLSVEDGTTVRILAAMEACRLVDDGHVVRWEKRQPKRERDEPKASAQTPAERMARYRARKATGDATTVDVSPSDAALRQVTPREEKSREEQSRACNDNDNDNDTVDGDDYSPKAAPLPMREQPPISDDPAVRLATALRRQGVTANSAHPAVQSWATKGVTVAQVLEAVALARNSKPTGNIPANYLDPIVNDLLNPPAPRAAAERPGSVKFNPNDQDRSGDARAMEESMKRHGITPPAADEEIVL